VKRSIGSKRTALIRSNCTDVLTENTTENTTDIKKPICPVAPQPDDIDPAIRVLSFQRGYWIVIREGRANKTVGIHQGRLSEDYSAEDLMLVVDYLTAKWADDPKMDDYLRPRLSLVQKLR
jgi:uncharacterized phage protein (TIGR02220 family)